jgi:hypothetical protein
MPGRYSTISLSALEPLAPKGDPFSVTPALSTPVNAGALSSRIGDAEALRSLLRTAAALFVEGYRKRCGLPRK